MSSILSSLGLVAAVLACLYFFDLWPFKDWLKAKQRATVQRGNVSPPLEAERDAAKSGFGRRTR